MAVDIHFLAYHHMRPFWRWLLVCFWRDLPRGVALKRSHVAMTSTQLLQRTEVSVWQRARYRVSLVGHDVKIPFTISGPLLCLPSPPLPTEQTLGGGPSVDGRWGGGSSEKLSREPGTSTVLHKVSL